MTEEQNSEVKEEEYPKMENTDKENLEPINEEQAVDNRDWYQNPVFPDIAPDFTKDGKKITLKTNVKVFKQGKDFTKIFLTPVHTEFVFKEPITEENLGEAYNSVMRPHLQSCMRVALFIKLPKGSIEAIEKSEPFKFKFDRSVKNSEIAMHI